MKLYSKLYDDLRMKYPGFIYNGFDWELTKNSLEICYHFEIRDLAVFSPKWKISILGITDGGIDNQKLEELIFSLGMVELISYWKLTCSPSVYIKPRKLNLKQIEWWKKLYALGLGEFFYSNNIAHDDDFMTISCPDDAPATNVKTIPHSHASHIPHTSQTAPNSQTIKPLVLVPIGGGKDSAVTLELLKDFTDRYGYIINPRGATLDTLEVAGLSNRAIIASRELDKNMLELNSKGFLNGHTPFSAIVAFSSVTAAHLNGLEYVALSNESTANEPTVADTTVNHQYSKSYEFESDFRQYEKEFIDSGVEYFSMLRPLSELRIAKVFSTHKKYHKIFRSCNVGSKQNIWCCNCAKCLFVCIILSPFLNNSEVNDIFGTDILDNPNLLEDFNKLVGLQPEKPFECVGSRDEVRLALSMLIQKLKKSEIPLPYLLKQYLEQYYNNNDESITDKEQKLLYSFDNEHFLSPPFFDLLKQAL